MRLKVPVAALSAAAALAAAGPSAAGGGDATSAARAAGGDERVHTAESGLSPLRAPLARPAAEPFAVGVALGTGDYGQGASDRVLAEIVASGARWIRLDIPWYAVQWRGRHSFQWSKYDALVAGAQARGLRVLGTLAYSPSWARPRGTSERFAPNTRKRRAAFARFAAAAATRYRHRVTAWEIWNEPNSRMFWQPAPNARSYALLVRAAYRAVKRVAPEATVLAGATAPAPTARGYIDEVRFLRLFYRAGGRKSFDAWSHHPYDFELPPGSPHKDSAWWQTYGARPSIRSVMKARGDGAKKIWATEYGIPSAGYGALNEAVQAARLGTALAQWRAFPWSGPIFNYMIRDGYVAGVASYWYYVGLVRSDWTRKPAFAVVQQAARP